MEPYIEIEHVTKRFGDDTILSDIDVVMKKGKVYGFSGNNGSGKTVLMKCICGFLPVTKGRIRVGGRVIGTEVDFPESLGVIIETPGFIPNLTGMRNLRILADLNKRIAQAIMEDPEFLILDEPFNGLDKHGVADIRTLLLELKERGKTIILASHNSEDIRILCDKVYEMDGGKMKEL